jgi:hypothetical protein
VPPSPPPKSRPVALTILLLLGGLLLLAPGVCAIIFIPEYMSSPNPVPSSIVQLWIISLVISAGGIALLVYTFRR